MKQFRITKSITDRSDELLDKYLKDIAKIPLISAEREIELADRIKHGDNRAREELISSNLRFVVSVAKQYQGMGIPLMDLISAGNIGLIKAADKFDASKGVKFISYAVWWIRQELTQSLFYDARTIRVPVSQTTYLNRITKVVEDFENKNERKPSIKEIAEILDTDEDKILEVMQGSLSCTSIDSTITNDDDDSCSLVDVIPNRNIKNSDYLFEESDANKNLNILLNKFSPREQDILRMFYGLEGIFPLTYDEIGKRFGLTGERIRQINTQIIEEIKDKYIDLAKELL